MSILHDTAAHSFASDNLAGAHPDVLAALGRVGGGHVAAYGEDAYTHALPEVLAPLLGEVVAALPALNGTGANVLALSALTPRHGAVLASHCAHIAGDEAAAPERSAGLKIITVTAPDGLLRPEDVHAAAAELGNQHHAQPTTLSLTNATEFGTVYTPEQVRALSSAAHEHGMAVHVDGSRLANAAAFLGVSPAALTGEAGVDAVSLGATKNGAMLAEAVVILRGADSPLDADAAAHAALMLRKGVTQLVSKQRYVSAQLHALFGTELWRENAEHANAMAGRLGEGLSALPGVDVLYPVQANAVFVQAPATVLEPLRERYDFFGAGTAEAPARLMCAFDTPAALVDELLADAARLAGV